MASYGSNGLKLLIQSFTVSHLADLAMQSYVYKKVTELTLLIKLNIENLKKNINPINTKIAIIETSQLVCSGNN